MRVLLPPSETKNPGGRGRPLSARPAHPQLALARSAAQHALAELLLRGPDEIAAALLLPPAVAADAIRTNAQVAQAPTRPALQRYAGTVYDGVQSAHLDPEEQRVLSRASMIFSGLFGVVRGDEPVPAYRVPAKAELPGLGVAATFWRPVLAGTMPAVLGRSPGLLVDLRSTDYAAMWRPDGFTTVTVRVLSPLPKDGHGVVSAASKHAKGRLAAALARRVAAGGRVAAAEDVAEAWLTCAAADGAYGADHGSPDRHGVSTLTLRTVTATLPGPRP